MATNNESTPHPQHNVTLSTIILCLCSFMNSYLGLSMFPYSGFMVMHFINSTTVDSVGKYAGLLASSFMIGRTMTAYAWGRIADTYGRVFVMSSTLLLAGVFSLLFGSSPSFTAALIWRFCAGMSNGTISVTKAMATEVARNRDEERRLMGIVIGMRSWGWLISPALGGLLADPLKQYPSWRPPSWIHGLLTSFPFILPNFLSLFVCLVAAAMVQCYLPETLPPQEMRSPYFIPQDLCQNVRLSVTSMWKRLRLLCCASCLPGHSIPEDETPSLLPTTVPSMSPVESEVPEPSILSRPTTLRFLVLHWLYAFVTTLIDEALPLFCMSRGMSMSEAAIGQVLSLAGLLFALLQYVVYIALMHAVGLHNSLLISSIAGVQPALLIPLSLLWIKNHRIAAMVWIAFVVGFSRIFVSLYFTCISLGLNKTVPVSQRATMNGIQVMGGSVARALGPIFAGWLTTLTLKSFSTMQASILIFSTIAVIGWAVTSRVWMVRRYALEDDEPGVEIISKAPSTNSL